MGNKHITLEDQPFLQFNIVWAFVSLNIANVLCE